MPNERARAQLDVIGDIQRSIDVQGSIQRSAALEDDKGLLNTARRFREL